MFTALSVSHSRLAVFAQDSASPVVAENRGGIIALQHSGIAQLAEHGTVNAVVAGSSPAPGATWVHRIVGGPSSFSAPVGVDWCRSSGSEGC